MTYDLEKSQANHLQFIRREDWISGVAVVVPALTCSLWAGVAFASDVNQASDMVFYIISLVIAAVLGGLAGLFPAFALIALHGWYEDRRLSLPHDVMATLHDVEESYLAILELNPSPLALEELMNNRNEYETAVGELVQIHKAMPEQDLNITSTFKWIESFDTALKQLQKELAQVRLESYSVARATPKLEASLKSVAEEREIVRQVLASSSEDSMDYLLSLKPVEQKEKVNHDV